MPELHLFTEGGEEHFEWLAKTNLNNLNTLARMLVKINEVTSSDCTAVNCGVCPFKNRNGPCLARLYEDLIARINRRMLEL